jgi:hypothetical protein
MKKLLLIAVLVIAPQSDGVCRQPRRCSCRVGTLRSSLASTPRAATRNGRFQLSINGRCWVSTEGKDWTTLRAQTQRGVMNAVRMVCSTTADVAVNQE